MATHLIWVCVDCMFMHANGECSENPDRVPLNLLEGQDVSLGMAAEEHYEDCDFRVSRACGDVADCNLDCESQTFSFHRCEGCGSTLGGTRHAMTIHTKD
jgi:hypothetical protein